ncbi:MAG: phosphate/phosphite/phosphonate ABC transporter substrate-binding protein [Gammaproteobacteria bacterium]|nr:phosphate/phosphite/phosphonate ABC transporter substrate-binding protein [Gammaproteobacteria bacterium]
MMCIFLSQGLLAKEYRIAVRAHHGIEKAKQQWQQTVNVLNAQFPEHRFFLMPVLKLEELTKLAGQHEFDFVLTNPSSFVEIDQLYGATALVTLNNKRANTAQDQFGSVIFTHVRNENIIKISDFKDKVLMAVSESAFGGWRMAWYEMLKNDFDPYKDARKLLFSKSRTHQEVVRAVRDSIADVGVVRTDTLENMESTGEIDLRYFRILNNKDIESFPFFLSTELYPEWSFAAMRNVPQKLQQQIQQILLSLEPETLAAKAGKYIGWVPAHNYSVVNTLMKKLKVEAYAE